MILQRCKILPIKNKSCNFAVSHRRGGRRHVGSLLQPKQNQVITDLYKPLIVSASVVARYTNKTVLSRSFF